MSVIVVTGASQGIGAEVAKAFAKNKKDNVVLLLARSEEKLKDITKACQKLGSDAYYFVCDVTKDKQVQDVAKEIINQWGAPDVLVNNAGCYSPSSIATTSGESFRAQVDVNLTSAFIVTQAFLPAMLAKKSGDLFFLCSIASLHAYPGSIAYCAAKHGLLGLSRVLREELKLKGMRVTAVMPGATLTPAWDGVDLPPERFIPSSDIAKTIVDIHQLDRATTVEEIVVRPQLGDI
jgi:NAD(P)-dependent dehydrogenase (short-subunit alcohol dehydrogenase family)